MGVQSLHFGIGVQLVEVAHTQGEIGIGEEFHGFCFGQTYEKRINVFFYRSFLQQGCKSMCGFVQTGIALRSAHNDAAGIEVIIQSLAFSKELRREYHVPGIEFLAHAFGITYGNGTLDDHDSVRIGTFH